MYKQHRQGRYDYLRSAGFLSWEAREISKLLAITPAFRLIAKERSERYEAFRRHAVHMIEAGRWRRSDVPRYWQVEIMELYLKNNWVVQGEYLYGTKQPRMGVGTLNPWELYRRAEKIAPGKRHISPWEVRQQKGTPGLRKGLIAIQRRERAARDHGGALSKNMLAGWLRAKERALTTASGERKVEIDIELRRLRRLYDRAS